jgi:hypothetical protein
MAITAITAMTIRAFFFMVGLIKRIGRHYAVKPSGNNAARKEWLKTIF